jgi:hypothetical protein
MPEAELGDHPRDDVGDRAEGAGDGGVRTVKVGGAGGPGGDDSTAAELSRARASEELGGGGGGNEPSRTAENQM